MDQRLDKVTIPTTINDMYVGEACFFSLNDICATHEALHISNNALSKKFGLVCVYKLDQISLDQGPAGAYLQTDIFHAVVLQLKKIRRILWVTDDRRIIQTFDLVKNPIEYYQKIKELKALHFIRDVMES